MKNSVTEMKAMACEFAESIGAAAAQLEKQGPLLWHQGADGGGTNKSARSAGSDKAKSPSAAKSAESARRLLQSRLLAAAEASDTDAAKEAVRQGADPCGPFEGGETLARRWGVGVIARGKAELGSVIEDRRAADMLLWLDGMDMPLAPRLSADAFVASVRRK